MRREKEESKRRMSKFRRQNPSSLPPVPLPPSLPPPSLEDLHEADELVVPHHFLGKVAIEKLFLLLIGVQPCRREKRE